MRSRAWRDGDSLGDVLGNRRRVESRNRGRDVLVRSPGDLVNAFGRTLEARMAKCPHCQQPVTLAKTQREVGTAPDEVHKDVVGAVKKEVMIFLPSLRCRARIWLLHWRATDGASLASGAVAHDHAANHRDDLRVRGRAGGRHLLHARHVAPRRWGSGRRRRGGMLGSGRDHRWGGDRPLAGFPALGTQPVGALLLRARRSRYRRSISSPGGRPAGLGGAGWRCVSSSRESLVRHGTTCMLRRTRRGGRSRRAWLQSWPMPRRMSASWHWGMR